MFLEMIYHSCNLPFVNLERNVHIVYIYVEHFFINISTLFQDDFSFIIVGNPRLFTCRSSLHYLCVRLNVDARTEACKLIDGLYNTPSKLVQFVTSA